MPTLGRAARAASDDPTVDAIAAIRAALTAAVAEDLASGDGAVAQVPEDPAGEVRRADASAATPAAGPFGHGKIRLHGRR